MTRCHLLFILCIFVLIAGCEENVVIRDNTSLRSLRPKAIQILRDGLQDGDYTLRMNSIEVVATTKQKQFMPTVVKLLGDDFFEVRFAAAVGIGDMKYAGGEYSLKRLIKDENPHAQIAAAYALTKLGHSGFSDLIKNAARSQDQPLRANAALLLGRLKDKRNLNVLYTILNDVDSSYTSKIQAIEAIAMLGDRKIYKAKLWALLISKYADDRIMGIRGMGALNTTDSRNAIITMLQDDVREVRLCAAEQLARLGNNSGEPEIFDYLNLKKSDIGRSSVANELAIMAIGRIGSERLNAFLPPLLDSKNAKDRLNAAQSVLLLTQ